MSLREWLSANSDDLMATVFFSVCIAALVGFRRRSKGAAIFLGGIMSAMVALVVYPVVTSFGYDWRVGVSVVAPLSGACSWALFGILMKISDRLEARDVEIADSLINKGKSLLPGADKS